MVKSSQKKLQNMTINLPSYIFTAHTLILLASFFMHFVVDNKVHDLCYEVKFENRVKDKNSFFIKQNISFLNQNIFCSWRHF